MTKPLQEYSAAELREFRKTLDPEKVDQVAFDQLDALILSKEVEVQVQVAVQGMRNKDEGKKFDGEAIRDWPELKDKKSDMYKRVQAVLESDPGALENPKAFKNAAMEVGISMGKTPVGFTPLKSEGDPMPGIGAGESGGDGGGSTGGEEFLKKTEDIADTFSDMLDLGNKDTRASVIARIEGEK